MDKYIVNYSIRILDGILKGRLYHEYLTFSDWHMADNFKNLCERGHIFIERDIRRGSYTVEDVTVSAIDNLSISQKAA
jgi:hypothetical protein